MVEPVADSPLFTWLDALRAKSLDRSDYLSRLIEQEDVALELLLVAVARRTQQDMTPARGGGLGTALHQPRAYRQIGLVLTGSSARHTSGQDLEGCIQQRGMNAIASTLRGQHRGRLQSSQSFSIPAPQLFDSTEAWPVVKGAGFQGLIVLVCTDWLYATCLDALQRGLLGGSVWCLVGSNANDCSSVTRPGAVRLFFAAT